MLSFGWFWCQQLARSLRNKYFDGKGLDQLNPQISAPRQKLLQRLAQFFDKAEGEIARLDSTPSQGWPHSLAKNRHAWASDRGQQLAKKS